jgi:hypothetical protein
VWARIANPRYRTERDISAPSGVSYVERHIRAIGFLKQKVDYIHDNPVKDKVVTLPEDYYFSSARNYASLENDLDVVLLDLF